MTCSRAYEKTNTYLFQQQPVVAEDSQRSPGVVTRNMKLIPAADFHGKHVALRRNAHDTEWTNDLELPYDSRSVLSGVPKAAEMQFLKNVLFLCLT